MLLSRQFVVDDVLWGTIYVFEKAGDWLPDHTHTEDDNHITMLLFGGIRCTGDPKHDGNIVEAGIGGSIINWAAGELHGAVATVDGTTIANIRKKRP